MYRVLFLIFFSMIYVATAQSKSPEEISAIKETARNYMESWYEGDAKKMKGSLHKKLAKRSLQGLYGANELRLTTASDMISYTKNGYGQNLWEKDLNIDVIILDYYKNIASVKVVTPHYYEYLHLAKIDKKWVILNALYEKNSTKSDSSIKK